MRKLKTLVIVISSVAFSGSFPGCVTDTASLKVEKCLPQKKLAYYNDSFDKFRGDLWDKAGFIYNEAQEANFKLADMRIENGKLRVETKTGCFSKAGLGSKYALRGDFDIQMDCQVNFLEGVYDMDQLLSFVVMEKDKGLTKFKAVSLCLLKKGGRGFNTIYSACRENGKTHRGKWYKTGNFDGTLRIVRIGDKISTLFKRKEHAKWKKMDTFWSTQDDVIIGFRLHNFTIMRTSITARTSISGIFDNFRINAAEEIIEEDI